MPGIVRISLNRLISTAPLISLWSVIAKPSKPFFFADMQTSYGGDTAAVRIKNTSQTSTQIIVEEEKSKDTETGHAKEPMGYLAIGTAK